MEFNTLPLYPCVSTLLYYYLPWYITLSFDERFIFQLWDWE